MADSFTQELIKTLTMDKESVLRQIEQWKELINEKLLLIDEMTKIINVLENLSIAKNSPDGWICTRADMLK